MNKSIVNMAKKSLRTLCFAYKYIYNNEDFSTADDNGVY